MKHLNTHRLVILLLFFAIFLFVLQAMAAEKVYLMTGTITGIDLSFKTVVVEVPFEGQMFTVGGPLSANAILKKAGRSVDLVDFAVGDRAKVKFRSTNQGHLIEMLQAF